jgi:hypothetical protein
MEKTEKLPHENAVGTSLVRHIIKHSEGVAELRPLLGNAQVAWWGRSVVQHCSSERRKPTQERKGGKDVPAVVHPSSPTMLLLPPTALVAGRERPKGEIVCAIKP